MQYSIFPHIPGHAVTTPSTRTKRVNVNINHRGAFQRPFTYFVIHQAHPPRAHFPHFSRAARVDNVDKHFLTVY
jgi:hypothetical protein